MSDICFGLLKVSYFIVIKQIAIENETEREKMLQTYTTKKRKGVSRESPVEGKRAELSTKRFINRDNWDSKTKGFKSEIKQFNQFGNH